MRLPTRRNHVTKKSEKQTEENLAEFRKRMTTIGEDNNLQVEKELETKNRPDGWAPGASWDGGTKTGSITTDVVSEVPGNWDEILAERGLDPEFFEIAGDTIKWTSWDGWGKDPDGETYEKLCFSYKADIRLRRKFGDVENPDLLELYQEAKKAKRPKRIPDGDSTLVIALSDWQIGNPDGGGTEAQVLALAGLGGKIEDRVKQLRKGGVKIETIALIGLGDLFENCTGYYRHQEFTVELDMRAQERVIRRAIFDLVGVVARLANKVIVAAVGGNHGENRDGSKRYTTTKADNTDVSVFEQVYDMCAQNEDAFGHIDWRIPNGELAISMEISGRYMAITHGHIAKSRAGAIQTLWGWWEKQALGRFFPGVATADILLVGHHHHLNVKEQLNRTLFIAPSLTDVSDYYGDSQGVMTSPGTLTFVVHSEGWTDLQVIV